MARSKEYLKGYDAGFRAKKNIRAGGQTLNNLCGRYDKLSKELNKKIRLAKLEERGRIIKIIKMHMDTHLRYGESTIETKMRFNDIISDIPSAFDTEVNNG